MKVLEKSGMQAGIVDTKKEIDTVAKQITDIRSSIKALTSLGDAFSGKTAESIFSFYDLCHEMFLSYMQEFLDEYSKVLKSIENEIDFYEPHPKGYVDEQFIEQDVTKALDKLEDQTARLAEEANRTMSSVSDIVALEQLKTWEFEDAVKSAKKKGEDTVEKLLELDHYKSMGLKAPEEKFALMKAYITQLHNSMPNPSWSIPHFHFGEAVRMPAHSVMYKHVHEEDLKEIGLEMAREERGKTGLGRAANFSADALAHLMVARISSEQALYDFSDDTVDGFTYMAQNPGETKDKIAYMFRHPWITSKTAAKNFAESIQSNVIAGNTATRSHWFTYAGLSVWGPKGVSAGVKGASKAAGAAGKALKSANEAIPEKLKGLNIGSQPAFSGGYGQFDGSYKLPGDVNLKEQLMVKSKAGEPGSKAKSGDGVDVKGTGNMKHLDDVPRIKEVEVNFKRNDKHDSEEFARQLKDQEKGMNELTIDEYLKNRDRYIAEGRAIEGNAAQKMARQEALKDKIAELRKQGLSRADATKQASEWLGTKAALHNPDQIAGGRADTIGGMGDKRVNSSIGSQWKYRIDIVDEQIREITKNMSPEQLKNTYLNVKLTQ